MLPFLLLLSCVDDRVQFVESMLAAPPDAREPYLCQEDQDAATPERLASLDPPSVDRFYLESVTKGKQARVRAVAEDASSRPYDLSVRNGQWCVSVGWAEEDRRERARELAEQDALEAAYRTQMVDLVNADLTGNKKAAALSRSDLEATWPKLEHERQRTLARDYGTFEQLDDYLTYTRKERAELEALIRQQERQERQQAIRHTRQCKTGQPCGASCISWDKVCRK